MNNTLPYTAHDLLYKVIDFTNLTPDSNEWSFENKKKTHLGLSG